MGSAQRGSKVIEFTNRGNRAWNVSTPAGAASARSQKAEESGVEIVKIFPGGLVGGPAFTKAVRGPMPWTRIMPTGGVDATQDSVQGWIKAGAACLGMDSKLVRKDLVAAGDYEAIRDNVRRVLAWIKEAWEQ